MNASFKTKPFDLEKALKGAPVVTRDGIKVEIIGYDRQKKYGVSFRCKNEPIILQATIKGRCWLPFLASLDLFLLDEETQEGGEKSINSNRRYTPKNR